MQLAATWSESNLTFQLSFPLFTRLFSLFYSLPDCWIFFFSSSDVCGISQQASKAFSCSKQNFLSELSELCLFLYKQWENFASLPLHRLLIASFSCMCRSKLQIRAGITLLFANINTKVLKQFSSSEIVALALGKPFTCKRYHDSNWRRIETRNLQIKRWIIELVRAIKKVKNSKCRR